MSGGCRTNNPTNKTKNKKQKTKKKRSMNCINASEGPWSIMSRWFHLWLKVCRVWVNEGERERERERERELLYACYLSPVVFNFHLFICACVVLMLMVYIVVIVEQQLFKDKYISPVVCDILFFGSRTLQCCCGFYCVLLWRVTCYCSNDTGLDVAKRTDLGAVQPL